jgi:hypothetical protein
MIESPLLQEYVAERFHKAILLLLERRFGSLPPGLAERLYSIVDEERLLELNVQTVFCSTLDAFATLLPEIDQPLVVAAPQSK